MKILLLEDNLTLSEMITIKLEKKGFSVYSFLDGQEALDNITEGFNCFVLDINVPNVDGIKLLKIIRSIYNDIPVIIISASVDLEHIKKCYDLGCSDYLKKPFFIDELEIKIDRLCNIHQKIIQIDNNAYFNFNQSYVDIDGKKNKLTEKENLFLNLLLKYRNSLVSYESIQNYVWNGEYASIEAIRTLVKRLKKNLEKPYIKSYSKRGYGFIDL